MLNFLRCAVYVATSSGNTLEKGVQPGFLTRLHNALARYIERMAAPHA